MEGSVEVEGSPKGQSKTLGIVSLVLAIIGLIMTVAALQTLLIGVALGFAGLVTGIIATAQHRGTGLSIAAIVIGSLCLFAAPISCVGHAVNL